MKAEHEKLFLENIITSKYRSLLRIARNSLGATGTAEIRKAFHMAYEVLKDKPDLNNEPFINRCITISRIAVEEIGLGKTSIICSLLYDAVHEGKLPLEKVKSTFGAEVAQLVGDLTKISSIDTNNTTEQAENFRKLLLSLVTDVRVILIKLSERLQVMRNLENYPPEMHLPVATETFFLYAPLAHRLGLYNIKSELEDISLYFRDKESYLHISRKLEETTAARN
ncbi:MAG: bifunctional (p)ppGpp synthetase/guanosine-3',5'-bis(diphosphate) 3'-pyrophosphohydrolase [Bacteroidales bacterium]|nr:bifunctional (p)ppGpp synthetase/guanosine-3',5'-bis(diphosphate) 3'-pyrophosphohydrolase [Bacteroidales bacterium]